MDILTRVNRLNKSLGNIISNLKNSNDIKSPNDIDPADDLGFEPSAENILDDLSSEETIEPGSKETKDILDKPEEDLGLDELDEPLEPESEEEPEEEPEEVQEAPEKPKDRQWIPTDSPDAKNLRFRSDKEGVLLDIRMLGFDPKLWLARIQRDGKLLDYGTILMPRDVRDPIAYIKAVSNAMLDSKSMRYEQEWQKKYAEAQGITDEEEVPPAPVVPAPVAPDEEEAPTEEELPQAEGAQPLEGEEDILAGLGL